MIITSVTAILCKTDTRQHKFRSGYSYLDERGPLLPLNWTTASGPPEFHQKLFKQSSSTAHLGLSLASVQHLCKNCSVYVGNHSVYKKINFTRNEERVIVMSGNAFGSSPGTWTEHCKRIKCRKTKRTQSYIVCLVSVIVLVLAFQKHGLPFIHQGSQPSRFQPVTHAFTLRLMLSDFSYDSQTAVLARSNFSGFL